MNANQNIVGGRLKADGTLQLDEKLTLPPGRVRVVVQTDSQKPPRENTWAVLERIWAERKSLGLTGRTKQQIDAEINTLRNETEDRMREIELIRRKEQ